MKSQRAGDRHPLLLSAGELMRVAVDPVGKSHLPEKRLRLIPDLRVPVLMLLFRRQTRRQHHVLNGGVLGKEIKLLEDHAEVKSPAPRLRVRKAPAVRSVEQRLALHPDDASVRRLEKIQTAKQRRLSASGGSDDRNRLTFLHGKADVSEDVRRAEMLADMLCFKKCHRVSPAHLK